MLLTYTEYRVITGDTTSTASAVTGALLEATNLIEELLSRTLEYGTVTESLQVTQTGLAFPTCVPVQTISAASEASGSILYGGYAINIKSGPSATFDMIIERTQVATLFPFDSHVNFTYTGGYTTATLPTTIKRAIARVANGLLTATNYAGGAQRPVGAGSVSMGDISISYTSKGNLTGSAYAIDELVPGIVFSLREYDRKKWSN